MDFSDDIQLLDLELFDATFAVEPGQEEDVKRRFMTLFVHESSRHRGGSAEVYRATNARGETFALKLLHVAKDAPIVPASPATKELRHASRSSTGHSSSTPDYVTQGHVSAFYEEYRVHLALSHLRGFPRLYGFGLSGGNPVIIMEWVCGVTLREALRERAQRTSEPLPLPVVASLGHAVLDTLLRARELTERFVHRDLSPRNIMLRTDVTPAAAQLDTGAFDLCLIDFGSAALQAPDDQTFTQRAGIWRMGTPAYAPPEMLTSDVALPEAWRHSPAIDVYALCSILYELYADALPFDLNGQDAPSAYRTKTERLPRPLAPRTPDGGALAGIILTGLSPQPQDRPDAAQLRDALDNWCQLPQQRFIGGLEGARPGDGRIWQPEGARRIITRRRFVAAGILGLSSAVSVALLAHRHVARLPQPLDTSRYTRATSRYAGEPLFRAYEATRGGWALCTARGEVACKPTSSRPCGPLREGLVALYDDLSQRYGFVTPTDDADGYAWLILPAFSQVGDFSEGLAPAQDQQSSRWGYIDATGAWVIPPRYQAAAPFSCGAAAAQDPETLLYGALDAQGSWLISPRYAALGARDASGHAAAQDASLAWGIVDEMGTWTCKPSFAQLRRMVDGLAPALDSATGRWGFIDHAGTWAIPATLRDARPFSEGQAAVQEQDTQLWHFVGPDGLPVTDSAPHLWKLGELHDGLAPAQASLDDDVLVFDGDPDTRVEGVGLRYGYVDATESWQLRRLATLTDAALGAPAI